MFRGHYTATLDSKGRIKIPTRLREKLFSVYTHDVYITCLSSDGEYVRIYPMEEWEKIELTITQIPFTEPDRQPLENVVNRFGAEASVDNQGRVLIPQILRESARIDRNEVLVLGKVKFIEIWNPKLFEEKFKQTPLTKEALHTLTQYQMRSKGEGEK